MNDREEQIQNELKNLENKQENIEKILDRGKDTIVIQLGTKYIRYGFANETSLFLDNAIAFKISEENKIDSYEEKNTNMDDFDLNNFYEFIEEQIKLEKLKKKNRNIIKNINNNDFIYEIQNDEIDNDNKNIYFGKEALVYGEKEEYILRKPIKNGKFNINKYYNESQIIQDIKLILKYIFEALIGIDKIMQKKYYLILTVDDDFDRPQIENLLDELIKRFNFKGITLHLESILASFCNYNSTSLIIDVGLYETRIAITDEGSVVPKSKKRINYGIEDIDYLIYLYFIKEEYLDSETKFDYETKNFIEYIRNNLGYFHKDNDTEEYFQIIFKNNIIKIFKGDLICCINSIFANFDSISKKSLEISIIEILKELPDLKKKSIDNIMFTGGISHLDGLNNELEENLINYITKINDDIERVHMIDLNLEKDIYPNEAIWIGASIISKLDSFHDYIILREKYFGDRSRYSGIELIKEKVPFIW